MALGKQVSEFSFKLTSFTYTSGSGEELTVQCNCDGSATGFGPVLGTMTATPAGATSSGRWSWCGTSYPESGEGVTGRCEGTFTSVGGNRWKTQGFNQLSDGRSLALQGEIDMAARTWSGQLYEWD